MHSSDVDRELMLCLMLNSGDCRDGQWRTTKVILCKSMHSVGTNIGKLTKTESV